MIRAAVVGGTGYTGVELLRLLAVHPEVELVAITSRSEAGQRVDDLFPNLRGIFDLKFTEPEPGVLQSCDVVFFATPHGVAQATIPAIDLERTRVIDLSADFRIRDVALWEQWYGQAHAARAYLPRAVYGLPELYRDQIRTARLVACPGCYPTAVTLGFIPLLEAGLVHVDSLIANAASGVSGAGRQARVDNLLTEAGDSFKAYGVPGHRHLPEIRQTLEAVTGAPVGLTFVPHLLPLIRGIHATLYARLLAPDVDLQSLFERRYLDEPFVDVMPAGSHPQTRAVRGSNVCRIAVHRPQDGDVAVVLVAEDNLTKGASGQAVQNMNIMFGLDERAGLSAPALLP